MMNIFILVISFYFLWCTLKHLSRGKYLEAYAAFMIATAYAVINHLMQ